MKTLEYQQRAVGELVDKTLRLLNDEGSRKKLVLEAPTGAGKTVMACQALAAIVDELHSRGGSRYQECAFIWFAPRKLHLQSYKSLKGAFAETRKLAHLGISFKIGRSTLSDANKRRSEAIFEAI